MNDDALASVLRKLLKSPDAFLAMDSHDRSGGRPVRFTIYDTSVDVTPEEEAALKKEIGW